MIVDLLRNDLGRVCEPGSVAAPRDLRAGELRHRAPPGEHGDRTPGARPRRAATCCAACFPGGSITGAPKRRAMEIIEELEPHRREVYCGAIGYLVGRGPHGHEHPHPHHGVRERGAALLRRRRHRRRLVARIRVRGDRSEDRRHPQRPATLLRCPARPTRRSPSCAGCSSRRATGSSPTAAREFSATVLERLRALPEYRAAEAVLATLAIGKEWNSRPFAEAVLSDGKMLVLPRVVKKPRSLELYAVRDLASDLVPGVWGIEEPDPRALRAGGDRRRRFRAGPRAGGGPRGLPAGVRRRLLRPAAGGQPAGAVPGGGAARGAVRRAPAARGARRGGGRGDDGNATAQDPGQATT